jgi:hypothetical protein
MEKFIQIVHNNGLKQFGRNGKLANDFALVHRTSKQSNLF